MRKFTKSLLTVALLVLAVGVANAEKKYADLSKLATVGGTNATWNGSTNTITWVGQSNNMVSNFDFAAGDYSTWEKVVLKVTSIDNCIGVRIQIRANGKEKTMPFNGTGTIEVNLSSYGFDDGDLTSVEWIRMLGSGYYDGESHTINSDTPGSAVISEFYLERPDVVYIEASEIYELPAGSTAMSGLTGADQWTISYPQNVVNETLWGGDIDSDTKSATITGYDYLHFVVSSASADAHTGLRVFVSDGSTRTILYPHPIADYADVSDWTATTWITSPGVYVVKISGYPYLRGFKALQSWAGNAGTINVATEYVSTGSPINYVSTGRYTLVGEATGSGSLTAALADANATCYDATGVTGTGVDLTSVANPNALFIASAGALANTKNVIVSGTCANLVLEDGHPFKAPADFTATAASYTTTITAAGAGTLCLPFAATIPGGAEAWTLAYSSGDAAVATPVSTTIPANTPVLINGSGETTFSGSGAVAAAASNVSGALTGVFAATTVPVNSYILQKQSAKVGFFKVIGDKTINPFRAYLTASSPASSLNIIFPEDSNLTGIESVKAAEGQGEFFNLAGQRVAQPAKGLYIVNGKKVIFK